MSTKKFLVIAGFLTISLLLLQTGAFSHEKSTKKDTTESMKMMHEHCEQALAAVDEINDKIDQAHKQNDVKALHTSLSEVQKSLSEIKDHINACMGMEHKEGEEEHKH